MMKECDRCGEIILSGERCYAYIMPNFNAKASDVLVKGKDFGYLCRSCNKNKESHYGRRDKSWIKPWMFILVMVTIALPIAIKHDHYIALLIWALIFLGEFEDDKKEEKD